MSNAKKAALLSALVFPGIGLWWLKHYWRAVLFIIPASISIWYLFTGYYNAIIPEYTALLHQASEGLLVVDSSNLEGLARKLMVSIEKNIATHQRQLDFSKYIFIASWLCSIASSYFAGKQQDLKTPIQTPD